MGAMLRIGAIADLHAKKTSAGAYQHLFDQATQNADILLIGGDLTDYGLIEEAQVLAKEISASLRIPALAVLGNHDVEAGHEQEIVKILNDVGVTILDGGTYEYRGVGFAGVKGFCGGFGRRALGAWGEKVIKDFVHESVNEALKLENALVRLRTPQKIALLHYAPIQATVNGEPPEIIAFLGSSRLEEPLDRYRVTAVFHGHAHRGSPEGRTKGNAPVYNVAMPLMVTTYPDRQPFRVIEVPAGSEALASQNRRRNEAPVVS